MTLRSELKAGLKEMYEGIYSVDQWLYMAIQDIKLRYRRSIIGPWWVTISTGMMIMMLGFLWSHIFNQTIDSYLPFFAIGFVIWGWMSAQIIDSAGGFFQFSGIIRQVKLPFTVFILRLNLRQLVILAHNSIIIFLVLLLVGQGLHWINLMAIPNLILVQLNLTLLSIIISIICTRYQDMAQVVNVITQVAFFFTPILWQVDAIKDRVYLANLNPIYHWIEMIRAPLLGHAPLINDYVWSISSLLILLLFSAYFLGRYRSRIAYWL